MFFCYDPCRWITKRKKSEIPHRYTVAYKTVCFFFFFFTLFFHSIVASVMHESISPRNWNVTKSLRPGSQVITSAFGLERGRGGGVRRRIRGREGGGGGSLMTETVAATRSRCQSSSQRHRRTQTHKWWVTQKMALTRLSFIAVQIQ